MATRFVVPAGWPPAPAGWVPPEGWHPDPAWGPAPPGWQFWIDDMADPGSAVPVSDPGSDPAGQSNRDKVSVFGARARVRELVDEVGALRAEMTRLGILDVAALERRRSELATEIPAEEARQVERLQAAARALEAQAQLAADEQECHLLKLGNEIGQAQTHLADVQARVVATEETAILQEVGVYTYRHPLSDAAAYQQQLAQIEGQIKVMTRKEGGAISAATAWTVNNSATQGRKMVADFSKLMLRAYNAEADSLIRTLKPYKLDSAVSRLEKVVSTIERLGRTMNIRVAPAYHQLRVTELELTADYLERLARDREHDREEKARLREERKAQQELEHERQRLLKEGQHYENAVATLEQSGDIDGAEKLRARLLDITRAIADVDYRAANVRAGYVYVISNVGSFGTDVVKIGMTRRLEPRDRIRELSDASVPFNFDVHALFFSADAVGIETRMHQHFVERRLNVVNRRREFFRVTPTEVRDQLMQLTDGNLLEFTEKPEALEYRQSQSNRDSSADYEEEESRAAQR